MKIISSPRVLVFASIFDFLCDKAGTILEKPKKFNIINTWHANLV